MVVIKLIGFDPELSAHKKRVPAGGAATRRNSNDMEKRGRASPCVDCWGRFFTTNTPKYSDRPTTRESFDQGVGVYSDRCRLNLLMLVIGKWLRVAA